MKSNSNSIKETRLNVRASVYQKNIILRAAKLRNTTISNFILQKAYEDAQTILAEESHFKLSNRSWEQLCKVLDRTPKSTPALKKLLTQPDIFDKK